MLGEWLVATVNRLRPRPRLQVGERYCPDCGGTRRTHWSFPALGLRCQRCNGSGKVHT